MAQAEKRNASNDTHIIIPLQAPEAATPQVLVKESVLEVPKSQSKKRKFRKLFSKANLNAKITEEVKCINDVKANLDSKILAYRHNSFRF